MALAYGVVENVLAHIKVGFGAGAIAKSVPLEFAVGFRLGPILVFHAVHGQQHPGSVQACLAMHQHGVEVFLVVQGQHVVDSFWAVGKWLVGWNEVGHDMEVAHAEFAAHFLFASGLFVERAVADAWVGEFILKVDDRFYAVPFHGIAETIDGELSAAIQLAGYNLTQALAVFPNMPVEAKESTGKYHHQEGTEARTCQAFELLHGPGVHEASSNRCSGQYNARHAFRTQDRPECLRPYS